MGTLPDIKETFHDIFAVRGYFFAYNTITPFEHLLRGNEL